MPDVIYRRKQVRCRCVAARFRRTTCSILYLVANQIKDGGVVVSSPIPSPCSRAHGGATAWDIPVHLPTCTILSLTQPTISCREREKHGTLYGYKVTGVPVARHLGLSRASVSLVPCSVANRALSTPCRIWVVSWSSRLTLCVSTVWVAL